MRGVTTVLFLTLAFVGCGEAERAHPWLAIPETHPHQVIESVGPGQGQLVIALPPGATPPEALEVGRIVLQQAPADAIVNARIYNDEATARNWRTVDAEWTLEHLWVLARRTGEGEDELRWVGPADLEGALAAEPDEESDTTSVMTDL
ncbi:MAG: hypothetical protein GEU90_10145 [Gemmatimonas sp.]|nr:hypothetical protein [Gemmatimonas sp.]